MALHPNLQQAAMHCLTLVNDGKHYIFPKLTPIKVVLILWKIVLLLHQKTKSNTYISSNKQNINSKSLTKSRKG